MTGSDACFAGPGARCASPGGSFGGTPGARSCLAAGDVSLHARNGLPAIGSCCSSSSRLLHRALMVRATVRGAGLGVVARARSSSALPRDRVSALVCVRLFER